MASRLPFLRGRPFVPGGRKGAGSYWAASKRNRVITVMFCRIRACSHSRAEKALSATTISVRCGNQRWAKCLKM